MDSTPASTLTSKNSDDEDDNRIIEKLEALVTPEQVHSASVARKRRTITRKRTSSLNKARSQTPLRPAIESTSTDDENDARPKTPERKRKPVSRNVSQKESKNEDGDILNNTNNDADDSKTTENCDGQLNAPVDQADFQSNATQEYWDRIFETQTEKNAEIARNEEHQKEPPKLATNIETKQTNNKEKPLKNEERKSKGKSSDSASNSERQSVKSETLGRNERSSSLPKQLEEKMHQFDNFVNVNTKEIINLFQKAKTSVEEKSKELRRRKFVKQEEKRSKSTPKPLTEEELLESFKRAEKASKNRSNNRSKSATGYSSESDKSPEPKRPLRKTTKTKETTNQKTKKSGKQLKSKIKSNKIIEILDPKTSKVIAVKDVGDVTHMKFVDTFKIFKYYSIGQIFKEYRKYKLDMQEEYQTIRKERRRCFNHLILLLIFCGLGGIMFKFIEGSFENFYKCGVKRVKRDFIELLWIKSHNLREDEWKSLARTKLRNFEDELHNAHEAGIHSYSGQKSWSFLNGIVYCLTIVTTIGYGHLYPTTTTGRALTIVYSLIGIPLFLIILTDFGKLFTRCIKFLWSFVRRIYYTGSCRSMRKTARTDEIFKGAQMMYEIATFRRPSMFDPNAMQQPASHDSADGTTTAPPTPAISNFEIDDEFNLPISVAILLLVLYILLGAVLFGIWEGWDFFASFYFVFISMSTIGFGDYVPRHPIFMIVSIVYLVFGLALMSMCINVVQVKLSDTFSHASAKIGATIGLGVAADDGSIQTIPPRNVEIPQVHMTHADSKTDVSEDQEGPT